LKAWFAVLALAASGWANACLAQGLLPDPPALVAAAPVAEGFRGALPARVDLSPQLPPPRLADPVQDLRLLGGDLCGGY
jgi:hypothetical protein